MTAIVPTHLVIRRADSGDAPALRRLAELDSAHVPAGPLLVAEADGELRAAIALVGGEVIADPFRFTSELVESLELARRAARAPQDRRTRRPSLRARHAPGRPLFG